MTGFLCFICGEGNGRRGGGGGGARLEITEDKEIFQRNDGGRGASVTGCETGRVEMKKYFNDLNSRFGIKKGFKGKSKMKSKIVLVVQ